MFRSLARSCRTPARQRDDRGFTLIELLVVVLIIGILAAIAIPVFVGQQKSAVDARTKSDLANARIAAFSYAAAHNGSFLNAWAPSLEKFGYVKSDTTDIRVWVAENNNWCADAIGSDIIWRVTELSAPTRGQCGTGP